MRTPSLRSFIQANFCITGFPVHEWVKADRFRVLYRILTLPVWFLSLELPEMSKGLASIFRIFVTSRETFLDLLGVFLM